MTPTMQGRWVGHCPILPALVSRGARVWTFIQWSPPSGSTVIRRCVIALGKHALTTGVQLAGDVVAGKNIKKAATRRTAAVGRHMMQSPPIHHHLPVNE